MSSQSPRLAFPAPTRLAAEPRVLVVYAHPQAHRSRVNRALLDAVSDLDGVSVHDLYERYPDAAIDIAAEQALLSRHGAVVFQHPLYWYATPPLLKEWLDVVLQFGWAYGAGGDRLTGKIVVQAVSAGGAAAAYTPEGMHGHSVEELLLPMKLTAKLCRMIPRPPIVVHDAHRLSDEDLAAAASHYRERIAALAAEVAS